MSRFRLYHALLAILGVLAYLTGEAGIIHAWLGYGLALVIFFRLLWIAGGERLFGFTPLLPRLKTGAATSASQGIHVSKFFLLGIFLSLLGTTVTGIVMDNGRALGRVSAFSSPAYAEEENRTEDAEAKEHGEEDENEAMEEAHELFANLMLFFVGIHIGYFLLYRRPLALYMLFMEKKSSPAK